ncbi:hypothetical protein [Tomitella biformata]|uniref:hypothetical protein n=1 Tax=Tomitella biformata TaxID=630403 RepID=UPI0004654BF1|nr:hypothetical protein [Tomitella biformata]
MPINASTVWKLLGLAGVVGVAATGAVAVRAERQRRAYTPDEVRDRLHERHARAAAASDRTVVPLQPEPRTARERVGRQLRRRVRSPRR